MVSDADEAGLETQVGEFMSRRTFPSLSSVCFEHPSDRAALAALKNTAGFDRLVKFIMALGLEPIVDYQNRSNYVRCDEKQCPELYKLYKEAVKVLDIEPEPPLFLAHHYAVNAWTFGSERPYVVVTSALVEGFTDEEVQCVMGHELGHILAGHSLYRTVGAILMMLLRLSSSIAGGIIGIPAWILSRGLLSAFMYWMRCAELTADRAGLLVTQNPQIAYSTETKLASGPGAKIAKQLSVERFLEQAREFETDPELNSKLLRFLLEEKRTHPFPVVRVREMELWLESGAYEKILGGDYTKRSEALVAENRVAQSQLDDQSKAVEAVIQTALSRVFGVFTGPKIPSAALLRAIATAPCEHDEAIVAIYEGGIGATDRVVLSTKRVYSSDHPGLGIPYSKITHIERESGSLLRSPSITINKGETKLSFHRVEISEGFYEAIEASRRLIQVATPKNDDAKPH